MVPRSMVFREYANWGGTIVSWTAAVYILTDNFAEAMLGADEDPMPLDGNPHPMRGNVPPQPFWGMPPFPALGWDANPANGEHQPEQPHGWGVD